jgi:hypothetical protein
VKVVNGYFVLEPFELNFVYDMTKNGLIEDRIDTLELSKICQVWYQKGLEDGRTAAEGNSNE